MCSNSISCSNLLVLLRSTKIKDRNEALDQLDQIDSSWSYSTDKSQVPGILLVIDSIFATIDIEKSLYLKSLLVNNGNKTVDTRLERSSNSIRRILSVLFELPNLLPKIKTKHYQSFLGGIMDCSLFKVDSGDSVILLPVALNSFKTLAFLLELYPFRNHLNVEFLDSVLSFILKCLHLLDSTQLEGSRNIALNERLIRELLVSLCLLINPEDSSNLSIFTNSDHVFSIINSIHFHYSNYFIQTRRASYTIVLIFQIINKLLTNTSIANIKYCHQLYKLGVFYLNHTDYFNIDSLKDQLVIFLNLIPDFIDLSRFPKLVGDDWNFRSTILNKLSPPDSSLSLFGSAESFEEVDSITNSNSNELTQLVNRLLRLPVENAEFQLNVQNIGLFLFRSEKSNWFELNHIYLDASSSPKGWLLISGVVEILNRVYRSNRSVSQSLSRFNILHPPARKRRKTSQPDTFENILHAAETLEELLLSMITSNDTSTILLGLQLCSFHLEKSFDYQESMNDNPRATPDITILPHLLRVLEMQIPSLSFWSLLCIRSLLSHERRCGDSKDTSIDRTTVYQLVKYSLESLKEESTVRISSLVLSELISLNSKTSMNQKFIDTWSFGENITVLFERMIDISEFNGPSIVSKESLFFWLQVSELESKLINSLKSSSRTRLTLKIQLWLFSKWNSFSWSIREEDYPLLVDFISWLATPIAISIISNPLPFHDRTFSVYMDLKLAYAPLTSFILEQTVSQKAVSQTFKYTTSQLSQNLEQINLLFTSLFKKLDDMRSSSEDYPSELCLLLRLRERIKSNLNTSNYLSSIEYRINDILSKQLSKNETKRGEFLFELFKLVNHGCIHIDSIHFIVQDIGVDDLLTYCISYLNSPSRSSTPELLTEDLNLDHSFAEDDFDHLPQKDFASIVRWDVVRLQETPENRMINFFLQALPLNDSFHKILMILQELKSKESLLVGCSCVIVVLERESRFVKNLEPIMLSKFVRLFAGNLLTNYSTERLESTIVAGCKLLKNLSEFWLDGSLEQDCIDICNFFMRLQQTHLISTEMALIEVGNLYLHLAEMGLDVASSSDGYGVVKFLELFTSYDNNFFKIATSNGLRSLLTKIPYKEQQEYFGKLEKVFETPQETVERSATYCLFLSSLSVSSDDMLPHVLHSLLGLSSFAHVKCYLPSAFKLISNLGNETSIKHLFSKINLKMFKLWVEKGISFRKILFGLLGFKSLKDFLRTNMKEIAAVYLSKNKVQDLTELTNTSGISIQDLVRESFPLSIALSFTSGGVRDEIFSTLRKLLGCDKRLTEEIELHLIFVIWQVLKFTDFSDLSRIGEMLGRPNHLFLTVSADLKTLPDPVISSKTSLHFFKAIIEKYYQTQDLFWTRGPVIFFLLRRCLVQIELTDNVIKKKHFIQKIKFLILIAPASFGVKHIIELVISLSPLLAVKETHEQVSLLIVEVLKSSSFAAVSLIPIAFVLLWKSQHGNPSDYWIQYLTRLTKEKSKLMIKANVYERCLDVLKDQPYNLDAFFLKELLLFSETFEQRPLKNAIVLLVSLLMDFTNQTLLELDIAVLDKQMINMLAGIDDTEIYSNAFNLWRARILGHYYLATGQIASMSPIELDSELLNDTSNIFPKATNSFHLLVSELLQTSDIASNLEKSHCESVIGALLLTTNFDSKHLKSMLDFDMLETSKEYILPLHYHTCLLASSEVEKYGKSFFKKKISDFHISAVSNSSLVSGQWISDVCMAIINEISESVPIVKLFAILVHNSPHLVSKIFQPLILFYVGTSKEAVHHVHLIIDQFLEIEKATLTSESITLILELILLIRVGCYKKIRAMEKLYRGINFPLVIKLAQYAKKPRVSLLLFEDYHTNIAPAEFSLGSHSAFLRILYHDVDEADILQGLPVKTNIDYAVTMLNQSTGDRWKNLVFDIANFDVGLIRKSKTGQTNRLAHTMLSDGMTSLSKLTGEYLSEGNQDNIAGTQVLDDQFCWSWRLSQWDVPVPQELDTIDKSIFKLLKEINEKPNELRSICEDSLKKCLIDKPKFIHKTIFKKQNFKNWFNCLAVIKSIEELDGLNNSNFVEELDQYSRTTKWLDNADVEQSDHLLLGRKTALESLLGSKKLSNVNLKLLMLVDLTRYFNLAKKEGEVQKSVFASTYMDSISQDFPNEVDSSVVSFVKDISKFHLAASFWQLQQSSFSVTALKEIINNQKVLPHNSSFSFKMLEKPRPLLQAILIEWMSVSRQDTAASIMKDMVTPMLQTSLEDVESIDRAQIYHVIANFCDKQLLTKSIDESISKMEKYYKQQKKELNDLSEFVHNKGNDKEERKEATRVYKRIEKQFTANYKEYEAISKSRRRYIETSIMFYLKTISVHDFYDNTDVDRFCGLWLEHSSDEKLNKVIHRKLMDVPLYKFITWINQLMSRLLDEDSNFQRNLKTLILELSSVHPFHTLYMLKSLRLNDASNDLSVISRNEAANKVWEKLQLRDTGFNQRILSKIDEFCDKAVSLAGLKLGKVTETSLRSISNGRWWTSTLPQLNVTPPTCTVPIRKDGQYRASEIVTISSVEEVIKVARSGISLPKIMNTKLSDGTSHKILLKGGTDDLRQDAIMEQVFAKVNNLFSRDKNTRKRNLNIRTYKVVPLGPQSGIIEFVNNSIALNDILRRFHSQSDTLSFEEARLKMKEVQDQSNEERLVVYEEICKKVHPVLRNFFFSTFLNPEKWFTTRINYTRGISSTSITGHILGLGDRHNNNILLDLFSGDPIHIDLGVAFDQGKLLPLPETVPFRLTRDIVDGFGITGVQGCFQTSAEYCFQVLREHSENIKSILDVLRYDPLYSWSVSPIRRHRIQEMENIEAAVKAQRDGSEAQIAIEGVMRKLFADGLSTEAVVRELIQEATDPANLSLLYLGWCPFY
ncbi:BA75_01719T0 [Komagataella pastoris]|uniref:Serine/threonine-protein kinase TEL1 n=1 Tax=Komagataella pastoris TaxID=4922 RepID=A0A1B2J9M5_PICPA|nr:BA75_01719T0 [Komagataella pastoris]